MSDKKYPYIGTGSQSKVTVLFYGHEYGIAIDGCSGGNTHRKGDVSDKWAECNFRDITREYLTNTYGKCESQEHADFICELAENAGFTPESDYYEEKGNVWFSFNHETGSFFDERKAKDDNEKLIHLPPPKDNEMESQLPKMNVKTEMPEVKEAKPVIATISPKPNNKNRKAFDVVEIKDTIDAFEGVKRSGQKFHCYKDYWGVEFKKPIYTKEMHERGEFPQVGSEVVIRYNFDSKTVTHRGEILFISNTNIILFKNGRDIHYHACDYIIEPIPTIEDELSELIVNNPNVSELTELLLTKYNITPKGGK